jgi:hypothetical protein
MQTTHAHARTMAHLPMGFFTFTNAASTWRHQSNLKQTSATKPDANTWT